MRLSAKRLLTTATLAGVFLFAGCSKKTGPPLSSAPTTTAPAPDRPEPKAPTPTLSISADPSSIQRNSQTTLKWQSSNATSVVIDNGVGNVQSNGSLTVTPLQSTTYTATATGPGGEARASTRVTVVRPAAKPIATDAELAQEAIRDGRIRPVFFAYDKAELTQDAKAILRANARWMREFPGAQFVIEGHCDERGSEEYNLALGDRRAQAAFEFIRQLGVNASNVRTISYGEERPFDTGHNEAAWAKNRRAHFRINP